MQPPTFGDVLELPHVERPAAYALLRTPAGVAAVVSGSGRLFLPGGGLLDDETPEQAVVRELMEECRFDARCVAPFGEAIQYFVTQDEGVRYRSHMHFLVCRVTAVAPGRGEHDLRWLREAPSPGLFAHAAHEWALRRYLAGPVHEEG